MKSRQYAREERILREAIYCVTYYATVREIAGEFGIPKSTVYDDLTKNFPKGFPELEERVKEVLATNKKIRYSHGGKAKAAVSKNI